MNLKHFLIDKKMYFIAQTSTLILLIIFLSVLGVNRSGVLFISIFIILGHLLYLVYEYFRRFLFYKEIFQNLEGLDKKHFIAEFIETPNFYEGEILEQLMSEATKSMNDEISKHKLTWKDYREYIETWVHEVKTPLAASYLILANNPSESTKILKEELDKVEGYVDQALYYARSNHVEKDYIIKSIDLEEVVNEQLRKASTLLINKKCAIEFCLKETKVYSDPKWISFIIGQLLANSVKYSDPPLKLKIETEVYDACVKLSITDNGFGIESIDIPHVFEKGFVGSTGRLQNRSTGIGLYLCNELIKKMGLELHLESTKGIGTTVSIIFPKTTFYDRL